MKKSLTVLFSAVLSVLLLLTACGGGEPEGCGGEHTYGEPVVIREPTCTLPGQSRRTCLYCDSYITETPAMIDHSYGADGACTMCGRYIDSAMLFALNEDGASYRVTRYSNTAATAITVPAMYMGKPVTAIAQSAFYDCRQLTSITLPSSLKEIGESAFYNCQALSSVVLPEGVETVGPRCFASCRALTSVTLPSTLTVVPARMFEGCDALTEITLPAGITAIGSMAFTHCPQLKSVTALGELTEVGADAFRYCGKLEAFTAAGTPKIGASAFKDCKFLHTLTVPAGLSAVGEEAFGGCVRLHSVTLAPTLSEIGSYAFSGCVRLAEVRNLSPLSLTVGGADHGGVARYARNSVIGDPTVCTGIERSGDFFFFFEEFTSLDESERVRFYTLIDYIGTEHSPLIPTPEADGFTVSEYRIAAYAFQEVPLVFAFLPEGVTVIEDNAFLQCPDLLSISVPYTTQQVTADLVFDCLKIAEIINHSRIDLSPAQSHLTTLPYAGLLLFHQDLDFPQDVTAVSAIRNDGDVLYYDDTTTVHGKIFRYILGYIGTGEALTIPAVPTDGSYERVIIRAYAFQNTAFTTVTIPSGVTEIAMEAFVGTTLGDVVIPSSVGIIGDCTFANSHFLSLSVPDTALCHNILGYRNSAKYDKDGYLRAGGLLVYASPTLSGAVTLGADIKNIGSWAFENCTEITGITLTEGVKTIGGNAFRDCTDLTEIAIPKSVTRLGATILRDCCSLERIVYGGTVDEWIALTDGNPIFGSMSSGTAAGVTVVCEDGTVVLNSYGAPAE